MSNYRWDWISSYKSVRPRPLHSLGWDLFWSSPVHLVIEKMRNLSLSQENHSFIWMIAMLVDRVCSLLLFHFSIKWLRVRTGKVFRVHSYWINDILNYLLTSSHHLYACVFLVTKMYYKTSVLKIPPVNSLISINLNADFKIHLSFSGVLILDEKPLGKISLSLNQVHQDSKIKHGKCAHNVQM